MGPADMDSAIELQDLDGEPPSTSCHSQSLATVASAIAAAPDSQGDSSTAQTLDVDANESSSGPPNESQSASLEGAVFTNTLTETPSDIATVNQGNDDDVESGTLASRVWSCSEKHFTVSSWLIGIAVLVFTVLGYRYSSSMDRYTEWTALKDFRDDCRATMALNQTSSHECQKALEASLVPPPLVKREEDCRIVLVTTITTLYLLVSAIGLTGLLLSIFRSLYIIQCGVYYHLRKDILVWNMCSAAIISWLGFFAANRDLPWRCADNFGSSGRLCVACIISFAAFWHAQILHARRKIDCGCCLRCMFNFLWIPVIWAATTFLVETQI